MQNMWNLNSNKTMLAIKLQTPAELTKSAAAKMAEGIVSAVENGEVEPLQVLAGLTYLDNVVKDALARVREAALQEAEKYGKQFKAYGVDFAVREIGVKYDYSDNKAWRDLQDNIDLLKAQQKGLETELRMLNQCAKSSTTNVAVTLPKG